MNPRQVLPRELRLDLPTERALELLAEAAVESGGEWRSEGGEATLYLPVTAGIRRGFVAARVQASDDGDGARLEVEPTESHLRTNVAAAGILAFGALGGLVAILWPFFPVLLQLAPIAAVLAVVAWLLVAGRLRSHGLDDFLSLVEKTAAAEAAGHADDPA